MRRLMWLLGYVDDDLLKRQERPPPAPDFKLDAKTGLMLPEGARRNTVPAGFRAPEDEGKDP